MWQNQIIFNYKYSQKMSLEKILHKIQSQINDLTPTLELFVDETIQPSVESCEQLQKQLSHIQENLAIYKYYKTEKELSPSFNLHAKVSEKELPVEKKEEVVKEIKATLQEEKKEIVQPKVEVVEDTKTTRIIQPVSIGINDKFRFINELFKQNNSEYNIAIEQLNTLKNWADTEIYLNSLKPIYDWKENSDVVNYFFSILKKRFS